MNSGTYRLYLATVAPLVCAPGPPMLVCINTALNHGPRMALMAAAGSVAAMLGVMLLSTLGLGALLAASETAFTAAKFVGAAYLIRLGMKTFRSKAAAFEARETPDSPLGHIDHASTRLFFRRGFCIGDSKPKALLFFAVFFAQFLNPDAPFAEQFAILFRCDGWPAFAGSPSSLRASVPWM